MIPKESVVGARRRVFMKRFLRKHGVKIKRDAKTKDIEKKYKKIAKKNPPSYKRYENKKTFEKDLRSLYK